MWDLGKERFLTDNSVLSGLKLKVSYGTQGNAEISNYAHISHLSTTAYGDKVGLYNGSEGNPDLGWETQKLFTVAVNVEFIDRIRFEAEFYNRATDDLLMDVPVPATSGYLSQPKNVGAMVNRGIDLTLNVDIYRTRDWYVGFNATFNYTATKLRVCSTGSRNTPSPGRESATRSATIRANSTCRNTWASIPTTELPDGRSSIPKPANAA